MPAELLPILVSCFGSVDREAARRHCEEKNRLLISLRTSAPPPGQGSQNPIPMIDVTPRWVCAIEGRGGLCTEASILTEEEGKLQSIAPVAEG